MKNFDKWNQILRDIDPKCAIFRVRDLILTPIYAYNLLDDVLTRDKKVRRVEGLQLDWGATTMQ